MACAAVIVISILSLILLAFLDSLVYHETFLNAFSLLFSRNLTDIPLVLMGAAIALSLWSDIRNRQSRRRN
ncbi:hypothetical protein AWJ19_11270 [Paenibacillus sp. DMB5]|nr:hypothetical protein AWJ19_11270 [Paenibacillus sp. DMB5]